MRSIVTFFVCFFAVVAILLFLPVAGEEAVYTDVLRLHVLADSDDTLDQTAKLLVRDAVLREYGEAFSGLKNKEEAEAYLRAHLAQVENTVRDTLRENGCEYHATVALTTEYFDTRIYGDLTLPAGEYTALKITLGAGEGQNYWCMLYPALCTEPAKGGQLQIAEEHLDEKEYLLLTDSGYAVKLRTLEILSHIFN